MNIKQFISAFGRDDLALIAKRAGTTLIYLSDQIANGHRKPSPKLARKLTQASSGALTLSSLRPDIWPNEPFPTKFRKNNGARRKK